MVKKKLIEIMMMKTKIYTALITLAVLGMMLLLYRYQSPS